MLGTIVNALAIIAGSLVGVTILKGRIKEQTNESIILAVSLAILLIGLQNAWQGDNITLVIISLALGTLIGETIGLEDKMNQLGNWLERKVGGNSDGIAKAFVSTSLIYCVGSMSILGALEGGLKNTHDILFAKAVIDGIISIIFASTMGIGVMFSSAAVFIYQGSIAMGASLIKGLLTDSVIANMTATGGLLIVGLGLRMLGNKKIRVGNMIPAIFIPLFYSLILSLF